MSHGCLILAVASILQIGDKDQAKPTIFRSREGGFSIAMPGEPTASFRTEKTDAGPLINKIYQYTGIKHVYTVICADYPGDLKSTEVEPLLNGVLEGYTQSAGGKLLTQKRVKFDGVPARDVSLSLQQGIMRSRYFVKRNRIYQILLFATDPKDDDPAEFQRFADSFRSFAPVGKLTDGMDTLTSWHEYRSEGGRYRVRMLGEPKETVQMIEGAEGKVELRMALCANSRGENFGVSYSPVARQTPRPTPKALYDAAVQGAADNLKGKILTKKAIEYDGRPGVEAQISLPGTQPFADGIFMVRMYWIGDLLYQVIYVGPRSNAKSKEVVSFLDSFQLDDAPVKGKGKMIDGGKGDGNGGKGDGNGGKDKLKPKPTLPGGKVISLADY